LCYRAIRIAQYVLATVVLLLDFKQHKVSSIVASPSSVPPLDFEQLRLDDARALLSRDSALPLPTPGHSTTAYLQAVIDGLCELSLKDPLSGLANRRHFRNVLDRTIEVVARSGEPALLLMLDIDHFKKVNDTYGHSVGDLVLQTVATALGKCVRPMDTLARYGGEEFAVILPNCHTYFGQTIAERIRQTIEQMPITVAPGVEIHVTVSIGGAYAPEWVRSTGALWTERADTQLYRAKTEGRNRVFLDYQQEIVVSAEEKNMLFGHLALGDPAWIENPTGDSPSGSAMQRVN
jgi:two-component system cell cycle response regulator